MSEELGSDKGLTRKIRHRYRVSDPQFRREVSVMLDPSITSGNRVTALHNGDEIFPAVLALTGGVGIADHWKGRAQDPEHWRDIHFRVDGPVPSGSGFPNSSSGRSGPISESGRPPRVDDSERRRGHAFLYS